MTDSALDRSARSVSTATVARAGAGGTTDAGATADGRKPAPSPARRSRRSRRQVGETLAGYSFLAPNLILLGVFLFVPLIWALYISFQKTNGFGDATFTGVTNYARLLTDPVFWRSALNTVVFTVLVTGLSMAFGLLLAMLMNSVLPARGVFRAIIVMPMAIAGVATALIGVLVFDQNTGILDNLIRAVGLPGVNWQSGSAPAFASVVLVTLWWRVGFNMIIYLGGLQSVNPDLYEAAELDGAGGWQRFRYVTVPLVGPSTFFLLIMNVIYSFHVFDVVYVLTAGGPRNATSVLVTYAYQTGFVTRNQGYAAAIGMFLLLVTLGFTLVQWKASRTRELEG